MLLHHTTSKLIYQAREQELLRLAEHSRGARQNASGDVTPASQASHRLAAVLVALLVVFGALALL